MIAYECELEREAPMTVKKIQREALWSAPFILILIVSLLVSTGHYMLMSTLPLYAVRLSGNRAMAGLMVTLLTISALLFRPFFGNLMDSRGRKPVLVTGAFILMATALLYNFTAALSLLLIIRFFQGAGFSAHTTSSGTIVADMVPASRLSEGIGYFGMANTAATALGPSIGLYCVDRLGYNMLFVWVLVLSVLSFLSTLMVNYGKKYSSTGASPDNDPPGSGQRSEGIQALRKNQHFIEATSIRPSLVMFFIALTFGAIIAYIPAFGISRKIDNIGIFFTVYAVAVLIARTFTGRIADTHGFTKVMIPGLIVLCLSLAILANGYTLQAVLLAGTLYGFGYGICYPLSNAIVIRLCPKDRRGAATATIFAAMDIGIGMGAMLWGWVAGASGYSAVFLLSSICILISLLLYMTLVFKRIPGEREKFCPKIM